MLISILKVIILGCFVLCVVLGLDIANGWSKRRCKALIHSAVFGYVLDSINIDDIACEMSKMYDEENQGSQ